MDLDWIWCKRWVARGILTPLLRCTELCWIQYMRFVATKTRCSYRYEQVPYLAYSIGYLWKLRAHTRDDVGRIELRYVWLTALFCDFIDIKWVFRFNKLPQVMNQSLSVMIQRPRSHRHLDSGSSVEYSQWKSTIPPADTYRLQILEIRNFPAVGFCREYLLKLYFPRREESHTSETRNSVPASAKTQSVTNDGDGSAAQFWHLLDCDMLRHSNHVWFLESAPFF